MRVGVTATQRGLTPQQRARFAAFLIKSLPTEFHHGGCVNGDDYLQFVVATWSKRNILQVDWVCKLVMHRGDTPEKWAACDELQDEIRDPKPNLERNKDIVDETDEIWAFPGEQSEVLRSGTWATIRYARDKVIKPVTVVFPDGSVVAYNERG